MQLMYRFLMVALLVVVAVGAWGEALAPLDLKSVTSLTLRNNPSLQSAGASVAQSQAVVERLRGALLPSVTAKSSYGYITKPTFFGTTPILETNTVINRVEVLQPIYTGGQLQNAVRAANYASQATSSTRDATVSEVVTNSAVAYLRALQARDAVTVAESSVKALQSSLDAATKLRESGVVTKADVLRAEVALATAKADLISAQNGSATALAALKTAIGLPQSQVVELAADGGDGVLASAEITPPVARPEVQAAGYAVKAADSQLRAAQAGNRPNVGMMVDFENIPVGAQFPRLTNTVGVGLQIKLNVFDGGQTRAAIKEAAANAQKARADLDSASQAAEFQLNAARLQVASTKARVDTLATQVKSAEESLRVVQTGYAESINAITDVLSVESSLTQARVTKLAADYDLKIAQLNLLMAAGRTAKLLD